MQVHERIGILRRLISIAAIIVLAWPSSASARAPEVTPLELNCPPGSEVSIEDYIVWVDGSGGTYAYVPIRAGRACGVTRSITFQTHDITARAGEDYVGINSGTVTLASDATTATIRIQIFGRTGTAPDETFGIALLSGARFNDPNAIVTIKTR